jgi:erythromycin esterase-like protein
METRATRQDYRCFFPYLTQGLDPSLYGRDLARGWMPNCASKVSRRHARLSAAHAANPTPQNFAAMMSARAVTGAEAYYRALYTEGGVASWNRREQFMADSIDALLERHGKVVVWAHNTHQGDARGTAQNQTGELSLGQLMRERHGEADVFLLGMTTYEGKVRAASAWAAGEAVKVLRPALEDSWPDLLHRVGLPAFILNWRHAPGLSAMLDHPRRDRAVGVLYLPDDELNSHYFETRLSRQYDAVLHIDRTEALDFLP